MMITYVTIVTSGDIKHLGGHNDDERREAWQSIQDEWETEMLGPKADADRDIYKEIHKLTLDIARIEMIVNAVRFYGLTDELKEQLGEECFFINSIDELQSVINQSKQLNIRLDILKKKADAGKLSDGETLVNKAMFAKYCRQFSNHFKYQISLDKITALEFCGHYREYCDYIDKASKTSSAPMPY